MDVTDVDLCEDAAIGSVLGGTADKICRHEML